MTFNDWWDSLTYIPNDKKILSKLAWEAAISCSHCGYETSALLQSNHNIRKEREAAISCSKCGKDLED